MIALGACTNRIDKIVYIFKRSDGALKALITLEAFILTFEFGTNKINVFTLLKNKSKQGNFKSFSMHGINLHGSLIHSKFVLSLFSEKEFKKSKCIKA